MEIDNKNQARIEVIGDQLRAKIQSKFQATTFLGGFCLSLVGIVTSMHLAGSGNPRTLPITFALLSFASVLLFNAVRIFDALTMPKRFWEEGSYDDDESPSRGGWLSEADLWNLKKLMVFFWVGCVQVAIPVIVLALLLMLYPKNSPDTFVADSGVLAGAIVGLICGFFYCAVVGCMRKKDFAKLMRPRD